MTTSQQLNNAEISALKENLSNEARVLYLLYFCQEYAPKSQKVTVKNQQIMALLNGKQNTITRGRQITSLLIELKDYGLISTDEPIDRSKTMNNQSVSLPLKTNVTTKEYFCLWARWRPDVNDIEQLSELVGLIDATYTEEEIGEFIAYWLTRNEIQLTSFQWTQKLVTYLKQRRLRKPKHHEDAKRGHQYATPESALHVDDNVKSLIAKYNK